MGLAATGDEPVWLIRALEGEDVEREEGIYAATRMRAVGPDVDHTLLIIKRYVKSSLDCNNEEG